MAKVEFLLQAVTRHNHADHLNKLFRQGCEEAIISVAFARTQGVQAIYQAIAAAGPKASVFVGIRNDITSYQALELLLSAGVNVYAVDTGSRSTIFHPKIFIIRHGKQAGIVAGSANLTFGGLHNNIEASSLISLNLADAEDQRFYADACGAFQTMVAGFPDHVIPVTDAATVKALFDTGRLSDETIKPANPDTAKAQPAGGALDPMPLHRSFPSAGDFYRVWQSNELKERDLNVPSGGNTNPTGSMYWKKGAYEIDQRHYFRDNVFAGLDWEVDARLPHYERTSARFHLYAAGEFKGTFELKLSHNTNTESTTYKQSNSMTQVSWGDAKPVVARRSLLGRIMHLYRKDSAPPEYMIEID
ncbi:phospholipase D-like domain-containing protein [Duganella radicis]|nr:phospholipase D family protein [Duganella radicis]